MSAPDVPSESGGVRTRRTGEDRTLVELPQEELIAKWQEFFEDAGYLSKIIAVADKYPEERSLEVAFAELNRFDTDMAIYLMRHPLNVLTGGEEAIRRLVPPGEELVQVHLRVKGLPRDGRVQIRDLRAKHLGQFISVEGLVRKSTEVRPRVVGALFQCLRCGTILKEEQDGQNFREPLECYEEQGGCKRSASATKFKLLTETSLYLDTQKLEIQEAPEGLRGGEEPQRLTAYVEDDLTGQITPGNRVIMNGILRSVQKGRPGAKSTLFDIFVDVNSVEREQVEFEEIEVTEEDARLIREAGSNPDIYRLITASIAPSLYGMYVEKEALALQLFSGVPKLLPDGRRIRGDIHLLLVGDPGTGKSELLSYMSRLSPRGIYATGKAATAAGLCVSADSLVATDRGVMTIENLTQTYFGGSARIRAMETAAAGGAVVTVDERHQSTMRGLETVWRLKPPAAMLEVRTKSGLSLSVTPATKVLVDHAMGQSWIQAKFVRPGMHVATASRIEFADQPAPLVLKFLRNVATRIVVDVNPGLVDEVVAGLQTRFGTLREAAARLLLTEEALYHSWRNRRHAIPLAQLVVAAEAAGIAEERVARAIRTYSQAGGHRIALPVALNPDLAYFAGLIAGDGSVEQAPLGGYSIRFSNSNPGLIERYRALARRLFSARLDFTPQSSERAATLRFHSALVATVLLHLGVPASPKSHRLDLPSVLLNGPRENLAAYLRGLYDTDGSFQARNSGGTCLSLSTTSPALARDVQVALLRFRIHARQRVRHVAGRRAIRLDGRVIISRHDLYVLDIWDSDSLLRYRESIGFRHPAKREALARLAARSPHSNVNLIHGAGPHLREIRRVLGLGPEAAYGDREGGARAVESGARATGRESLLVLVDRLSAVFASGAFEGPRVRIGSDLRQRIPAAIRLSSQGGVRFARALGLPAGRIHDAFYRRSRKPSGIPVRLLERIAHELAPSDAAIAAEIDAAIRPYLARIAKVPKRLEFLRILASGDVRWEPIHSVRAVASVDQPTVYDLTVKDAHAFVANGILVHNTAAAVRDEFGEGRWTLEAGALVLADLGLACLHPDAEVLIDGTPVRIEELFNGSTAVHAVAGGRNVELSPLALPTVAFDLESTQFQTQEAAFVVRRPYRGTILRVKLSSGHEVKLTPNHVVLEGESFRWKQFQELKPGARLLALREIHSLPNPAAVVDITPEDWLAKATTEESRSLQELLVTRVATAAPAVVKVAPGMDTGDRARAVSPAGYDYTLERIVQVRVEEHEGFVYDLRVPGPSNFVCDGVVVHNCIDEIEKMNPQDRSAIHEAMEQQRISVAKAGITAVLQSRCAVLAAANPKFGRFDEHKYISEQIDLPPALLSRFDIIFSMIDRPQAEKDRELAEHVLKGHQVGEILKRRESGLTTPKTEMLEEPYTPHFNPDFLRKYVAYAKRIYPVMTDEAMAAIEKKYLEIRKTGEGAGSSVPITPRQLEAIIRLSEASARLRLSNEVSIEDADRAVRIVEYWMGKVAGEEGKFDIDIIQTGISQSQREQIISLRDIINELAGPEGVADYEDIVRLAQERGIPPAKVDSWLKRWSQEGEIYSPAKNKYKLVERL